MDQVSNPIIHKISTYLTLIDAISFEQTCRSVLIGCRSSKIPIHKLTSSALDRVANQYPQRNISHIRPFKSSYFGSVYSDTRQCNTYDFRYGSFKHLKELQFKIDSDAPYRLQNEKGTLNINRLIIEGSVRRYAKQLSSCADKMNVEYVDFQVERKSTPSENDQGWNEYWNGDYQWLTKLKGISGAFPQMLRQITSKLESYHNNNMLDGLNGKLRNLKELCITYQIYQIDAEAMKGLACLCDNDLVSLKRLNIQTPVYYGDFVPKESSRRLYQQFIIGIIKHIEYVSVDQYCCQDIFEFMLKGMVSMREKRDRLKIRIN